MFIKDALSTQDQLSLMLRAIDSARNGIVMTDPRRQDNPIIYTNPAFTGITGYSADEILGHNCRFLQGSDREQAGLYELRLALKEERAITTILRNYRKDGSRFFNELTVSPVRNPQGELIAFVGIQNDISARIEAEQRISDFYSIVSHELRNPIAKIKSSLAVIADGEAGPINETVRRFVEISVNSAESLWKLIENILDIKKLESGKFRLLSQRIQLAEFVKHIVFEFRPVAQRSSIELSCECLEEFILEADPHQIAQVIENLLSNAVKFSATESSIKVRVFRAADPKFVRVEVIDKGIGISPENTAKLFDKFQQLDSPDRRQRGGSGLGLSICKAIIEAHKGRVGVESVLAKGSTFWFELPLFE